MAPRTLVSSSMRPVSSSSSSSSAATVVPVVRRMALRSIIMTTRRRVIALLLILTPPLLTTVQLATLASISNGGGRSDDASGTNKKNNANGSRSLLLSTTTTPHNKILVNNNNDNSSRLLHQQHHQARTTTITTTAGQQININSPTTTTPPSSSSAMVQIALKNPALIRNMFTTANNNNNTTTPTTPAKFQPLFQYLEEGEEGADRRHNLLLPTVFLVGCAKCGTTAFASRLARHPNIAVPSVNKEPRYFAGRLVNDERAALVNYLAWMKTTTPTTNVLLDATPFLLLDGIEVATNIVTAGGDGQDDLGRPLLLPYLMRALPKDYGTKMRPLAILRKPADMLFSRYTFFCMLEELRLIEQQQEENGTNEDEMPGNARFHRHVVREIAHLLRCVMAEYWDDDTQDERLRSILIDNDNNLDNHHHATTTWLLSLINTHRWKVWSAIFSNYHVTHTCVFRDEPFDVRTPHSLAVQKGLYVSYLDVWKDAFPNMLILKSDDFLPSSDLRKASLRQAFLYIFDGKETKDNRSLTEAEWVHILSGPDAEPMPALPSQLVMMQEHISKGGMLTETRDLLDAFFSTTMHMLKL
mmetsp:Transcript_15398/g.38954  ORF Transcript_15398/g.38954 Transcript_15398/m.38954 type:complete len:585 (-) Transcript_15398:1040-2794(-)